MNFTQGFPRINAIYPSKTWMKLNFLSPTIIINLIKVLILPVDLTPGCVAKLNEATLKKMKVTNDVVDKCQFLQEVKQDMSCAVRRNGILIKVHANLVEE